MLLGTLGARLLGNMLAGKGVIRAGEGAARVGYGSKRSSFLKTLIPPHTLSNFEVQIYYQKEPTITHKIFETNSNKIAHYGKRFISVF